MSDPAGPTSGADVPRCSAKACRAAAKEDLQWRNPRLHDAARVKHWLACPEHGDRLADFLATRGFLLGRGPLAGRPGGEVSAADRGHRADGLHETG